MNRLTELRKQFQQLEEPKTKSKSKLKRSAIKSEQTRVAHKFHQIRNNGA